MDNDSITINDVSDFDFSIWNSNDGYFVEKYKFILTYLHDSIINDIYERFDEIKNIEIMIHTENSIETKSINRNLFIDDRDKRSKYILYYNRPNPKLIVKNK